MSKYNPLACPFCGEQDFDDVGLKIHLLAGHCDVFNDVPKPTKPPTEGGASG